MKRAGRYTSMPLILAACLPLLSAPATSGAVLADVIVESWTVGTSIVDRVGSNSAFSQTVANPFATTHSAQRGLSTVTASYDFSWTGDEASFGVSVDHHLEQLDGSTSSSGRILIWPAVDSVVTFTGQWQYSWPGAAIGSTSFYMSVIGPEGTLAENISHGGNVGIGPPFGSFDLSNSAMLEAGGGYLLYYIVQVQHFDPTPPGTFGTGNGQLNFTITPVPEPSTLALLALTAALLRRRRSCLY